MNENRNKMEILLVTGEHDSGKSGVLYDLAEWLQKAKGYSIVREFHAQEPKEECDKEILLSGKKQILIHPATDDSERIDDLRENLDTLEKEGITPDILITTCRRFDDLSREYECTKMGWKPDDTEGYNVLHIADDRPILGIPLIRIKYDDFEQANKWYKEQINRLAQHILLHAPYDI